ncbi:hypothetical protein C440_07517 [Haloferax mucosum ATCC BAA-1512]|uniref:Uncharacterized protein n=1 Tax=Haloferax mucosum ATCC BAA-1512 TaxID=662479 RepID=M0IDQ9_9EURY|nr:hypothetical protein [Haloferax mucosum]ELZ94906.1 hypothetical protein C440_07517 [Haloferax mucosum ATCC BAA-1512]
MGIKQFSQPVSGTGGQPVATNAAGTIETDNYAHGGGFDFDGSTYPYTLNPAETIQELVITIAGNITARITTTGGDTFDLKLAGGTGTFDKWEIDSVEFRDPNGTNSRIAGGWAGE